MKPATLPPDLSTRYPRSFYEQPTDDVARQLLGAYLFHRTPEGLCGGMIVETEAYQGPEDLGAHSSRGRNTDRIRAMFGPRGHAYIYLIYGMYWCFNVVAGPEGLPRAVLIRALEPLAGLDQMRLRLNGKPEAKDHTLCQGPGKLCKALGITGADYGLDLDADKLFLVPGTCDPALVATSPRINIDYAGEWALKPWRFYVRNHASVSGPPKMRR
jgi:DNA-3-methyladenine glycosylase